MAAMPFADGLSVEANFVTRTLVKEAHVAGKNLYAWTVNKEAAMAGVIAQGVDGVITNDPVRARELMGQMHMNGWAGWMLGLLFR